MIIQQIAPSLSETDLVAVLRAYNDVTERLKKSHEALAREVCRLRDELADKNRELRRRERLAALGEMAAGVAHEIRNPLGGIGLYASLLERDLDDRPEQRRIAQRIGAGVQSLESIVRDTLSFAGDAEPRIGLHKLGCLLDAVLERVGPVLRGRSVEITVGKGLDELALRCDGGQVERALLNLVLNATDVAGTKGRVWIQREDADECDGFICLAVEDDGPGIDPAMRERIFHPFFTTKDHGTGLGLAIVHRIAEAHGGRAWATARSGGGASIRLTLPLAADCPDTEFEEMDAAVEPAVLCG